MATCAGQFPKGVSGNPGGRPRIAPEVRELARSKAPDAFKRIVELVNDDDPRVALAASNAVLDRAYGKPATEERKTTVDLGPVASANDIVSALSQLLMATAEGELGITELKDLASVIEVQRRAIETHELEQRLQAVERLAAK